MTKFDTTHQKIIRTAIRLFETAGDSNVTIRQVIGAANIHRSTFYHHFPDYDALLDAMIANKLPYNLDPNLSLLDNNRQLITIIDQNKPFFRTVLQYRYKFEATILQLFSAKVRSWDAAPENHVTNLKLAYGALIGVISVWLQDPEITKADVTAYLSTMI